MVINFIRPRAPYAAHNPSHTTKKKLKDDLSEASTFNDADLPHWNVLNAVYRELLR